MQPFCFQLPYGQKEINFVTTQSHHFAMSRSIQMIYIYVYKSMSFSLKDSMINLSQNIVQNKKNQCKTVEQMAQP